MQKGGKTSYADEGKHLYCLTMLTGAQVITSGIAEGVAGLKRTEF